MVGMVTDTIVPRFPRWEPGGEGVPTACHGRPGRARARAGEGVKKSHFHR